MNMIRTQTMGDAFETFAAADAENLCGLLEKKNRWLGWSTRSVRLKGDYIEYSKRNGKTRILKLADIISVSAKGVEVEFVVLNDVKQFKLKLRAENEILAYRWLNVVEAARRKLNGNSRPGGGIRRSGSDTRLNRARGPLPGMLKRQATAGDIPFDHYEDGSMSETSEHTENRGVGDGVGIGVGVGVGTGIQEMNIVESPRAENSGHIQQSVESSKGQSEKARSFEEVRLTKKAVLPDVVGGFAKDLLFVFVQPVFQALHIFVNSLKKQK